MQIIPLIGCESALLVDNHSEASRMPMIQQNVLGAPTMALIGGLSTPQDQRGEKRGLISTRIGCAVIKQGGGYLSR